MNIFCLDDAEIGLYVKIRTLDQTVIEGMISAVLTKVPYHLEGIEVEIANSDGKFEGRILEYLEMEPTEKKQFELKKQIKNYLNSTESQFLEFKETFSVSTRIPFDSNIRPNKLLQLVTAKTIQAFANSLGGTLLIGIEDATHSVKGLSRDYTLLPPGKQNEDGFQIEIKNKLTGFFNRGSRIFDFIDINIVTYDNEEICMINVQPSQFPFILHDDNTYHYYVRKGNASLPYSPNDFMEYWIEHIKQITI